MSFSSLEHPQFETHQLKMCSKQLIPVILNDNLPSRDGCKGDMEKYHQYLLLLFKPWCSFEDLKQSSNTWSNAFARTSFKPYCTQLMENMLVDSECCDARNDHSARLSTIIPPGDEQLVDENGPSDDGTSLSHFLAEVGDLDDLHGGVDETEGEYNITDTLTDSEADIYRVAKKHIRNKNVHSHCHDIPGECIELHPGIQEGIKEHGQFMSREKKNKRPRVEDDPEEGLTKKHHICCDPRVNISRLLDDIQDEQIHASWMCKDELLEAIKEVHTEFCLEGNIEQSRMFHIAAEHFAFNSTKQLLLFITGIGGSRQKSHYQGDRCTLQTLWLPRQLAVERTYWQCSRFN